MSSVRIEKIACNAVSKYIADCRCLVPQIDENDKTPIWDGDIQIYESEQIDIENFKGRYPLQVKGTEVDAFTEEARFPARTTDLINFAMEGGCVFFVVQELWDEENEETKTRIFYKFLDKVEIQKLLSGSNSRKKKSILLKPLCGKKSLFIVEINKYLQIKQQSVSKHIVPSLSNLIAYTSFIETEVSSCQNSEIKNSLLALIESIRTINTNDTIWIDKVIAYSRGIIAESQGLIDEYTIAGWFFAIAEFCEEITYYRYSEKYYYKSLDICQKYVASDWQTYLPNVANTLSNLGNLHVKTLEYELAEGELKEALSHFKMLADILPDKFNQFVALAYNNLGEYYRERELYKEAESVITIAVHMRRELNLQLTESSKMELACSLNNLGLVHLNTHRYEECINELEESLDLYQSLSDTARYLEKESMVMLNLGNAYSCLMEYDKSEKSYLAALKIDRELADKYPDLYAERVAQDLNNLGEISRVHGENTKALHQLEEAISIYRKISHRCVEVYALKYLEALRNYVIISSEIDNKDKAIPALDEALEISRRLSAQSPVYFGDNHHRIIKTAISYFISINEVNRVESLINEGNDLTRLMYSLNQEGKNMTRIIDKQKLVNYLKENKVVWQFYDGLIDAIEELNSQSHHQLVSVVQNCNIIEIVGSNKLFGTPFEELAQWSTEEDALILLGDEALLCIPKKDVQLICKQ